jgi:hypothetical protein
MNTAVPCYYHLDVEVSPERVGQVRRILAAHLRYWDLEILVEPVCHGTELLLKAIDEHATDKNTSIEMWWNGQHLIAAMSDGWGCCATDTGSKVIWFSQRARAGERVPLVPSTPVPDVPEVLEVPREVRVASLAGPASTPEGVLEDAR